MLIHAGGRLVGRHKGSAWRIVKSLPCFASQTADLNANLSTRKMSDAAKRPKVYITRNVHDNGVELLGKTCDVIQWQSDEPVPRNELLQGVAGVDALFCLLSDKIDKEVIQAAGKPLECDLGQRNRQTGIMNRQIRD